MLSVRNPTLPPVPEEGITLEGTPTNHRRILRIGHRGAAGHAPENTLAAIRTGIALGADFVELDVQRTRDGHLVLMHDLALERTVNATGLLSDFTWQQLQWLDATHGQRIPSLEAALATANGRTGVMLEAKTPGLGPDLYRAVQGSAFAGPVIYASFLHADLLAIRQLDPHAKTLALIEGVPLSGAAFARDAAATHAGLAHESATPEFVAALHAAGLEVFLYTVNAPAVIRRALALGADGLISDYPDRVPKTCPAI